MGYVVQNLEILEGGDSPIRLVRIGRFDENNATKLRFDISAWINLYGMGIPKLLVKRHGDSYPYLIELTWDGNCVEWTVSNVDTSKRGRGEIQMYYYGEENDLLAKSSIITTECCNSLEDAGPAPDPYDSWIQRLIEIANTAILAAERAEQAAQEASDSADDAEESSDDAKRARNTAIEAKDIAVNAASQVTQFQEELDYVLGRVEAIDQWSSGVVYVRGLTASELVGGGELSNGD